MKYCVIKNTTTIIDGSENPQQTMIQNAINSGFTELEVEFLTEDEYKRRLDLEPALPVNPTDLELFQKEQIRQENRLSQLAIDNVTFQEFILEKIGGEV